MANDLENTAADAIADALTARLNALLDNKSVDVLADAIALRINNGLVADIAQRLRVDVLAGDDLVLSRSEAARFIGRSVKTLELWSAKEIGPKVTQIGPRAIGYRVGDLRAFCTKTPGAEAAVSKFVSEGPNTQN